MRTHLANSGARSAMAADALRRTFTVVIGLGIALAGAQTMKADLTVTVFAEHFVVAGRSYDDMDRLADAVAAMRPKAITLAACGPAVTRSLMAAAYRFQKLPLRINVLWAGEPGCPAAPHFPASAKRVRQGPSSIDDPKVDLYWRGLMP
jgi:hypothetical protein